MAQLRNALRAYAVEEDDPAQLLVRLDRLAAALAPDDLATAVVATVDPATGDLQVACAGHPSPILVRDGRAAVVELECQPPLGAGALWSAEGQVRSTGLRLGQSDTVMLVSDGMYERRGEAVDVSLAPLVSLAEDSLGRHADLDDSLRDLMTRAPGTSIDDDVTLLLVRRG